MLTDALNFRAITMENEMYVAGRTSLNFSVSQGHI